MRERPGGKSGAAPILNRNAGNRLGIPWSAIVAERGRNPALFDGRLHCGVPNGYPVPIYAYATRRGHADRIDESHRLAMEGAIDALIELALKHVEEILAFSLPPLLAMLMRRMRAREAFTAQASAQPAA